MDCCPGRAGWRLHSISCVALLVSNNLPGTAAEKARTCQEAERALPGSLLSVKDIFKVPLILCLRKVSPLLPSWEKKTLWTTEYKYRGVNHGVVRM